MTKKRKAASGSISDSRETISGGNGKKVLKKITTLVFLLAVAGFAGWSFYSYLETEKEVVRLSTIDGQQEIQKQEVSILLDQVRKHMLLPDDEQPTVATVTDVDELKRQQPFFEKAINGDKVIIYVNSHKAIIYSPEKDIIVNVGTLLVDDPDSEQVQEEQGETEEPQPQEEVVAKLGIEIRNGTKEEGLIETVSNQLKGTNDAFDFVTLSEASKKDYSQTVVVDMGKGGDGDLASSLAQELGVSLSNELPEGEKESEAQVVVIVGEDQKEIVE